MNLIITPQTKVGELLDAYSALEEVLIGLSPHFVKLRNPILRRTVGKVATLQAAAATGGVDVAQLIRTLREAVGQAGDDVVVPPSAAAGPPPAWLHSTPVVATLDVEALLNAGEHPLARVTTALREAKGEVAVRLTSAFRPEPLIEKLTADGYRVHAEGGGQAWVIIVAR